MDLESRATSVMIRGSMGPEHGTVPVGSTVVRFELDVDG